MNDLRTELEAKLGDELRIIARKLRIKGRNRLSKAELVQRVLERDHRSVRRHMRIRWWDRYHNHVYGLLGITFGLAGIGFTIGSETIKPTPAVTRVELTELDDRIRRVAISIETLAEWAQSLGPQNAALARSMDRVAAEARTLIIGEHAGHPDDALERLWSDRLRHVRSLIGKAIREIHKCRDAPAEVQELQQELQFLIGEQQRITRELVEHSKKRSDAKLNSVRRMV